MLVNDWMNTPVVTISARAKLERAAHLMTENEISILPVVDEDKLVGVITDRDLKRAAPSNVGAPNDKEALAHIARVTVGEIMSRNPITAPPDYTLEETARALLTNNISGCPVVSHEGELIGVITKKDIFRAIIALTGVPKRGVLFGFMLDDRPGSIKEVTDVIRRYHARLVSILATYFRAPKGFRYVYIRAFQIDRRTLPDLRDELASTANLLYMVDLRDGKRENYASATGSSNPCPAVFRPNFGTGLQQDVLKVY
jgi:acetoin utilization protein AcuB